jgi:hypothetical protein
MTREVIARTPPPAFLFPINNVKDPTASAAPPFNARRRRGGRCLIAPEFRVNRFFSKQSNRLAPGRRRKRGSKEELQLVNQIIRRFLVRLFSALSLAERVKYLLRTLSQPASSRKANQPTSVY